MKSSVQQIQISSEQQAVQNCKSNEKNLELIAHALADITIEEGLDSTVMLHGVQAFLMAMVASRRADKTTVGLELSRMSSYWLQPDC